MANFRKHLGAFLVAACGLTGCGPHPASADKPTPPAKVDPIKESQLNTVVLTPEAERRVGLETTVVEYRAAPRFQSFGGEVTLPASATLTVSAPVSGTLHVPKGHELPHVGTSVQKGQPMFALVPHVLTQAERVALAQTELQLAQARVDAEGQVKQAQVQVDAAHISVERAQRLFRQQAGTRKDLDDAEAQLHLAEKALDAARTRKNLVDGVNLNADDGGAQALVIPAPRGGIVRATYAVAGQMVPAGSPLFELMNVETVWIKVPVYVGELPQVAQGEPARVGNLAAPAGAAGVAAKPVRTPPTAQPQASAVDLYYELPNSAGRYRPGERVSVLLPLRGEEKSLVLPWSAVVHDVHGGSWVYVQKAAHTYERRRVQVRHVVGNQAVLAEGPAAGQRVVTTGAAEVFGAEFGFGK